MILYCFNYKNEGEIVALVINKCSSRFHTISCSNNVMFTQYHVYKISCYTKQTVGILTLVGHIETKKIYSYLNDLNLYFAQWCVFGFCYGSVFEMYLNEYIEKHN